MELTAKDADRTIELTIGDTLVMRLGANPGTGFQWVTAMSEAGVLTERRARFDAGGGGDDDDEGSPGQEVITLAGARVGTTELTFAYRRPWETDVDPEQTVTVLVTVTGDATGRNQTLPGPQPRH